jgi:hypothetical protein
LVENPQLPQDARSTEYKKLSYHSINIPLFIEPGDSLQVLQQPTTCIYITIDEFSFEPLTLFLEDNFPLHTSFQRIHPSEKQYKQFRYTLLS